MSGVNLKARRLRQCGTFNNTTPFGVRLRDASPGMLELLTRGTLAIERFLRPVSYQNLPQSLLPAELRDGGSAG